MPRLSHRVPSYSKHKASGQAVVTLDGRDFYLGPHGSRASRSEYDRLVGEWQANGRRLPTSNGAVADLSVNELIAAHWLHAEQHYRRQDGTPTSELKNLRLAMCPLKRLYGHTLARDFGPLALKAVRQAMIAAGHCRTLINRDIGRIKRVFKWGVENELVQPSVHHGLQAVRGLQRGRSDAKESAPVKPVPEEFVTMVLDHVRPQIAAMIRLQLITGMRSGELVTMRGCDLDMSGKIWAYTPGRHKTEHHGYSRVIYVGPRAQAIIKPWLKTDLSAYLFSPREAKEAWYAERRANRKSPMTPSQAARRRKRNPKKAPGDRYTTFSYRRAIAYAVEKINDAITKAAQERGEKPKLIPHWHPHQLRHNAATRLRKEYGIEAARVVLGHRSSAVTEVYAEIDHAKAADIMGRVG